MRDKNGEHVTTRGKKKHEVINDSADKWHNLLYNMLLLNRAALKINLTRWR